MRFRFFKYSTTYTYMTCTHVSDQYFVVVFCVTGVQKVFPCQIIVFVASIETNERCCLLFGTQLCQIDQLVLQNRPHQCRWQDRWEKSRINSFQWNIWWFEIGILAVSVGRIDVFIENGRFRPCVGRGIGRGRRRRAGTRSVGHVWRFYFAPRTTDADAANDRTSLDRRLDQCLYLLVKNTATDQWSFPHMVMDPANHKKVKSTDTTPIMKKYAMQSVKESAGAPLSKYMLPQIGGAPIGFHGPRTARVATILGRKTTFSKRSATPVLGRSGRGSSTNTCG